MRALGESDALEIGDTCAAGELSPAALRPVTGPLPLSGRPWPPAVRDLAVGESVRIVGLITETAGDRCGPRRGRIPPAEPVT